MFTNVRVKCETDYVKLQFDPPLPRVKFMEICPISSSLYVDDDKKNTIKKYFFSIRCSIIDEERNYSDIDDPSGVPLSLSMKEETISDQKRTKNYHFSPYGEVKATMVATKTDEFVSCFDIRIEDALGKPYRKSLTKPIYILLKLYH